MHSSQASALSLCAHDICFYGLVDLRRGLRMFSPARLMTTSQRGSPDLLISLCGRKYSACWYYPSRANCPPHNLPEAGPTHVIRPGPGCLETNLTSWPLAFSSWVRAVPMNPDPPPDGRAQTCLLSGVEADHLRAALLGVVPSGVRPLHPTRRCRGDTGHEVSKIQLLGLGNQG